MAVFGSFGTFWEAFSANSLSPEAIRNKPYPAVGGTNDYRTQAVSCKRLVSDEFVSSQPLSRRQIGGVPEWRLRDVAIGGWPDLACHVHLLSCVFPADRNEPDAQTR